MTKQILVGGVPIGGGAPISVQSMTNTKTEDVEKTVDQILRLEALGCDIIRLAVPSEEAAKAISKIKPQVHIPIVADIHFNYKLAIAAMENGADKIRINPGNLGGEENLRAVCETAKKYHVPIRVGVNAGSLEKEYKEKYGFGAEAMAQSALSKVRALEAMDFHDIVISLKASSVPLTYDVYRRIASMCDYPLHVGVTEAGTPKVGLIKSAAGIGALLLAGIGDTIRVSLTADPEEEVKAAIHLLRSLELKSGPSLVSCPTCGRTQVDLIGMANQVEEKLLTMDKNITVAVMGCVVNGPGEASHADVGIAGGKGSVALFRHGEVIKTVPEEDAIAALFEEIEKL
ncbi:MAG: flavodoxin-dependent (E)-4-hydroxy-3-methylbut-2-enyl-diphosphate synthase [Clostridia bacterium]|nr:flavodoxin-dependent (E)-4-hydroxy-3-methylbut-2-enyl-diphosphate synthase [Clostridia bacterium]